MGGIDQQWQMNLADMQSMQKFNDGYRYLLVCIDVFSKYAWVVPRQSFQSHFNVWAQTRKDYDRSRNRISKQTFPSVDERRRY
jgi:hypothetical protein